MTVRFLYKIYGVRYAIEAGRRRPRLRSRKRGGFAATSIITDYVWFFR